MSLIEARLHAAVMIASTYSHRSHWPKGSVSKKNLNLGNLREACETDSLNVARPSLSLKHSKF